jgi:hypothetical protein
MGGWGRLATAGRTFPLGRARAVLIYTVYHLNGNDAGQYRGPRHHKFPSLLEGLAGLPLGLVQLLFESLHRIGGAEGRWPGGGKAAEGEAANERA